jgi:hypothetical protein
MGIFGTLCIYIRNKERCKINNQKVLEKFSPQDSMNEKSLGNKGKSTFRKSKERKSIENHKR